MSRGQVLEKARTTARAALNRAKAYLTRHGKPHPKLTDDAINAQKQYKHTHDQFATKYTSFKNNYAASKITHAIKSYTVKKHKATQRALHQRSYKRKVDLFKLALQNVN